MDPPPEPPEEMQPAHKLILVQWTPFQASDFRNRKRINLHYFKSLKFMVICYNDNRKSVPSLNLLVCVTCEWNPLVGFDGNTLEQHEELNSIPVRAVIGY